MRAFTPGELTAMRDVQTGAMMDTCTLRKWAPTTDNYGTEIEGWTETTGVDCGLDVSGGGGTGGGERRRLNGTIVVISATLRLSLEDGAGLTEEDKVTVTHRNGEALTPALTYGIAGQPQRGPTGYVLQLVEVR
jgi:hypothetical protein